MVLPFNVQASSFKATCGNEAEFVTLATSTGRQSLFFHLSWIPTFSQTAPCV